MLNEKIINKLIINVPHHKYDGFGKKGRKKEWLNTMHARNELFYEAPKLHNGAIFVPK
jgi:hypothetical protein